MFVQYLMTPVGAVQIEASEVGLTGVAFIGDTLPAQGETPNAITQAVTAQLSSYFQGQRQQFDLPLMPHGSIFQQQVWQQLLTIPAGSTINYAQLAAQLGKPKAAQAVGQANGRNPIAVIIPCHRVIGKDGSLTGYAGGLERKAWLLQHEAQWQ